MSEQKDYYKILGITDEEKKLQGTDFEKVVKKKYRDLCKQWHPDKWGNKGEEERKKALVEFALPKNLENMKKAMAKYRIERLEEIIGGAK